MLIFNLHRPGQRGLRLLGPDATAEAADLPAHLLREHPPALPEVSEPEVIRHYTRLSRENFSIDTAFYPLGSCTMKHNPKVNDALAALPGFTQIHPYATESDCQGALELMHRLEATLGEITGLAAVSLQPAAGASGELTAMHMVRAYHAARGESRTTVLIPDSAHGTNPASAHLAGFRVAEIPSGPDGRIDLAALRRAVNDDTASMMVTNPNTLGVFEAEIQAAAAIVHDAGGLLYMDGANLNAILGKVRPGDMGFDLVHLNLHKTFSTPHGGGGPGAGPVAVTAALAPFLPGPRVARSADGYHWADDDRSIGRVHGFAGNFAVLVRAYAYIRTLGAAGLAEVSEQAVLNANYLRAMVGDALPLAFPSPFLHECVLTAKELAKRHHVTALDVAKRLIDHGVHPPTIYFPLIAPEALMVEPTETESKATLDAAAKAFREIVREARESPMLLHEAPHTTNLSRLDETRAARHPVLVEPLDSDAP
ncbi:MAG: aminomethyl-transferring glycine dehydrogenase subunit GcvPB [Nitrospirota bacterium]|jgi:glycine dehydrogenase subunit 2